MRPGLLPGLVQGLQIMFHGAHFMAAKCHFFVQSFAALATLADSRAKIRRLLRRGINLLLQRAGAPFEPRHLLPQRSQSALGIANLFLHLRALEAQFAELAFPRQDAGLSVVSADRERAVCFQELTLKSDEAIAACLRSYRSGRAHVTDDEGLPEEL